MRGEGTYVVVFWFWFFQTFITDADDRSSVGAMAMT